MKASIVLLLFLTSGCAYFVNTLDKNRLSQELSTYRPSDKKLYCEEPASMQLVNSNKESQKAFKSFLRTSKNRFSFADKVVLWSLIQMNLRPDLASPTSKLQLFVESKDGFDYFHFYSKQRDSYPYIYGLKHILKKYKSRYTLEKLASFIDARFPAIYTVGKDFDAFLSKNKLALLKDPSFKRRYMRADETLKENEKIQKENLQRLVKSIPNSSAKIEISESLFNYQTESKLVASCNYDMKLYSNSIYLIHEEFIRSHLFGLKTQEGSFMASASQRINKIESVANSIFFKGDSQTRSSAFCSFKFPTNKSKKLWMVSSESRDPGQHIYHMMGYGLKSSSSPKEISELVTFSRHLFLEDPTRLVFESNRSSKQQLEGLLRLNLPIYNARKLGNVWS
ncbi:MAG: hypothetical protein KC478_11110, partial [Bacteriovoracaceae bacterium]|nr:hypothetical protein [Bacteriovoracaceae bacterium]